MPQHRHPYTLLLRLRKSQGTDRKTLSELKPQGDPGLALFLALINLQTNLPAAIDPSFPSIWPYNARSALLPDSSQRRRAHGSVAHDTSN